MRNASLKRARVNTPPAANGRDDRKPEYRPEVACPKQHQSDTEQRAKKGSNGIQRLTQAVGGSPYLRCGQVRNQGIAGSAAYSLAYAIHKTGDEYPMHRDCKRENGLGNRAQAIAEHGQNFALSEIIAERAGKYFHDECGRFGDAFDQSDDKSGRAQA